MKYELIIFDLDGTLLNTSEGIFNSVRYAEQQMGLFPISEERLREFVGPPPKEMYMKVYGVSEDIALEAARKHREYGKSKAIYEAKPYPNVISTLGLLKTQGYKLAVATLKSKPIADKVLRLNQLYDLFDVVVGMDENETFTKCKTINMAKNLLGCNGHSLMVGDSLYDYEGAMEAKVDFLGVTYGFGFHKNAQYEFDTIDTFEDLYQYVKEQE